MIREMTEEEKEIFEYSNNHSYKETMEKFNVSYWKVADLRRNPPKQHKGNFVTIQMINKPSNVLDDKNVTLHIGRSEIVMSVDDFRKAFIDD